MNNYYIDLSLVSNAMHSRRNCLRERTHGNVKSKTQNLICENLLPTQFTIHYNYADETLAIKLMHDCS